MLSLVSIEVKLNKYVLGIRMLTGCPMYRESLAPPVQVKEPYGNLDMVTSRLLSCNPEFTKYIPADNACEGVRQYIKINRYILR